MVCLCLLVVVSLLMGCTGLVVTLIKCEQGKKGACRETGKGVWEDLGATAHGVTKESETT